MQNPKKARPELERAHDGQEKNNDGKENIRPAVEDVKCEIRLTYWQDVSGFEKKDVTLAWPAFCRKVKNLPRQHTKEKSPLIKLATFGDSRTEKGCLRHDDNVKEIYGVEGDIDSGKISFDETIARLEQANIRAMVVTTHSHTPEEPRLRILAPLSGVNSPLSRRVLVARINGVLGGHLAGESFNLSQSFFIGGKPGGEYRAECTFDDPEDGWCVDEMPELDAILDFGKATEQEPDRPEVGELNEDLKAAVKAGLEPEHIGGGKWILHCPWRDEHTKDTVKSSTIYFEPHTNGFKGGGFKCLHDHCSHRTIKDFRDTLGINQPETAIDPTIWDNPVDVASMLGVEPPPLQWFIANNILRKRGFVLTGVGGSSKTRLIYQLAIAAATGVLPWSWEVKETGKSLLVLTEDVVEDVHRCLYYTCQSLGLSPEQQQELYQSVTIYSLAGQDIRLLKSARDNTLVKTDLFYSLQQKIKDLGDVVFVGLDPALSLTDGDELDQGHQRALGKMADDMAVNTGATVVLVTHASKSSLGQDEVSSHTSRGAGAITDAARGEFALRTMTAQEAKKAGIEDIEERKRHVQLVGTKGNALPPAAYVPVWLRRDNFGTLLEADITFDEGGHITENDTRALNILKEMSLTCTPTLGDWRTNCLKNGLISDASKDATKKAMDRIVRKLSTLGLIKKGHGRGIWLPNT